MDYLDIIENELPFGIFGGAKHDDPSILWRDGISVGKYWNENRMFIEFGEDSDSVKDNFDERTNELLYDIYTYYLNCVQYGGWTWIQGKEIWSFAENRNYNLMQNLMQKRIARAWTRYWYHPNANGEARCAKYYFEKTKMEGGLI